MVVALLVSGLGLLVYALPPIVRANPPPIWESAYIDGTLTGDFSEIPPSSPWTIGSGQSAKLTGGTFYWGQPIVVQNGGLLEFDDVAIIGNFDEIANPRVWMLDNSGSVYMTDSTWEPYIFMPTPYPEGEANIVYGLSMSTSSIFSAENATVKVDVASTMFNAPLWVKGGNVALINSTVVNTTFWYGTPAANSIRPMKDFTLRNTQFWQNKTGSHPKGGGVMLPDSVRYYGIFHVSRFGPGISGATRVSDFNFNFDDVTFNGKPLYGGTKGPNEDVIHSFAPDEDVGGILYFYPKEDAGNIVISGGNFSEGQGTDFIMAQDGYQGPIGTIGDISVTNITCWDVGRGSCNINTNARWNRRDGASVMVADNNFYSITDSPRMGMRITASGNAIITRNHWHGNVSSGVAAGDAIVSNNRIDGFGSMEPAYTWHGEWMMIGDNVLFENNRFGNISSAGGVFQVTRQAKATNITIRNNYFGNISSNPDTGDITWVLGLYSGTNNDPGNTFSDGIRISNNTFIGAENWGNGYIFIGFGCVCGRSYQIPWQVHIDNNTFDAGNGNNRQQIATNYGSSLIDSTIENNVFVTDHIVRLQNNRGDNVLRSNQWLSGSSYTLDLQNHARPDTMYTIRDHVLDEATTFWFNDNPYRPDVILDGNTMVTLDATNQYYDPEFSFANYFIMGQLGVQYDVDTTRWISDYAEARFEGFSATIPKSDWFSLTMNQWSPDAGPGEVVASWTADSADPGVPVWFNMTGLMPGQSYDLFVDGAKQASDIPDGQGEVSFAWSSWSSHDFEVRVDPAGWSNTAPTISNPIGTGGGTHNVTYSQQFTASDPNPNQTLLWTLDMDASFLSVESQDRTAWINGTPTFSDTNRLYYVNVTAADQGCGETCNLTDFVNYTLYINNTLPTIINPISNDTGTVNRAYSRDFDHLDINGDAITWTLDSNASFLSLNQQGVVSGTPGMVGTFYVNVAVGNSPAGDFVNYTLTIESIGGGNGESGDSIPTFNVVSSYEVLTENVVQFNAEVYPQGQYTYLWEFGDGQVSAEQNPTHRYQYGLSARFNVRLTVCSEGQCTEVNQQVSLVKWTYLAIIVGVVLLVAFFNLTVVVYNYVSVNRALKGVGFS